MKHEIISRITECSQMTEIPLAMDTIGIQEDVYYLHYNVYIT